eukprot:1074715-Prymnesium_polylepis.1
MARVCPRTVRMLGNRTTFSLLFSFSLAASPGLSPAGYGSYCGYLLPRSAVTSVYAVASEHAKQEKMRGTWRRASLCVAPEASACRPRRT